MCLNKGMRVWALAAVLVASGFLPAQGAKPMVDASYWHTVGLRADGTVAAAGYNACGQCEVGDWTGIEQVAAGNGHTAGLRADRTVVAVGWGGEGQCDVAEWKDIVQIAAGSATIGLRADGTVVVSGDNTYGQCNTAGWKNIVQVAVGECHTVGLRADGTVAAVGYNNWGQCDVGEWKNIVQVAAGVYHTVGLKADGTVVAAGLASTGNSDVSWWTNVTQVAADSTTVGLRGDGTVLADGFDGEGQCGVKGWNLGAADLSATVEVPAVTGLLLPAARDEIARAGLAVGTITRVPVTLPACQVANQLPKGGSFVRPGTRVDLVVFGGPAPGAAVKASGVKVPDVKGMPVVNAWGTLTRAGLRIRSVTTEKSAAVRRYAVTRTIPGAGAVVKKNTPVRVVYSTGAK